MEYVSESQSSQIIEKNKIFTLFIKNDTLPWINHWANAYFWVTRKVDFISRNQIFHFSFNKIIPVHNPGQYLLTPTILTTRKINQIQSDREASQSQNRLATPKNNYPRRNLAVRRRRRAAQHSARKRERAALSGESRAVPSHALAPSSICKYTIRARG